MVSQANDLYDLYDASAVFVIPWKKLNDDDIC